MSSNDSINYSPVPPSEQTPRPVHEDLDISEPVSEAPPGYFMGPFLPWSKDATADESSIRIIDEIIADKPEEKTIILDDTEIAMEVTIVIFSEDEDEPEGLPTATSTPLPPFSPPIRSLFAEERASVDFSLSSTSDSEMDNLFASPTPSEQAYIDEAYEVEVANIRLKALRRPREDVMDDYWRLSEKNDILEDARDALQEWLDTAPPSPQRRRVMDYMFGMELDLHVGEERLRQLLGEAGQEQLVGANVTPSPEHEA